MTTHVQGKAFESILSRQEKVSSEVFQSLLGELINASQVRNFPCDEAGKRLGRRICDDVFARYLGGVTTLSFIEACEIVARVALKLYFGIQVDIMPSVGDSEFSFSFQTILLPDFGHIDCVILFLLGLCEGLLSTVEMRVNARHRIDADSCLVRISLV